MWGWNADAPALCSFARGQARLRVPGVSETRECNVQCCAVDCVEGPGATGVRARSHAQAVTSHARAISRLTPPVEAQLAVRSVSTAMRCTSLSGDCAVSWFGDWGACTVRWRRSDTLAHKVRSALLGGKDCPHLRRRAHAIPSAAQLTVTRTRGVNGARAQSLVAWASRSARHRKDSCGGNPCGVNDAEFLQRTRLCCGLPGYDWSDWSECSAMRRQHTRRARVAC